MALNIAPLLIHSDAVPGPARDALRAAWTAPPESRASALESAARVLYSQTELDCCDARELVGLAPANGCS
ncbi:MAG TPA: hypothetical protein VM686_17265 [Polyangiaceae bacterium]|nr:hypothetical protein [Polyangiaceae bacterium]